MMQEAISFLYDKMEMENAHKIAFKTQTEVESSQKLPIPDGFSKQDCSFFTMKFLEYYGADTARQLCGDQPCSKWGLAQKLMP